MAAHREAPACGGSERPSSHSPISVKGFLGAGRDPLSRPRRFLARRREVWTADPSPLKIAVRGMGAGPMTELRQFGILWVVFPHKYSWLAVVCLSPRFYPH